MQALKQMGWQVVRTRQLNQLRDGLSRGAGLAT
jgi:hypothetical protein